MNWFIWLDRMATSVHNSWVGKSMLIDWSTFFTFYWQDFNPNVPSRPSEWQSVTTSWETSYNLSWFQVGNEVCCWVFVFLNDSQTDSVYISWDMDFQKSYNGSTYYSAWWSDSSWGSVSKNSRFATYYYVGVDDDEIWLWETYYRFHVEWSSTDWNSWTINTPFTVSNLSFDDSLHKSWYFRVEWNYLCYTDWTWWSRGYKHKINYDTGYSWWSGDPWYVWIPSSNDNHIYYTSANGTVRRTHTSSSWYGYYWGNYAPSWAKSWMIWVSDGGYEDWYGYLCYVNSRGQLRRMWNWEP